MEHKVDGIGSFFSLTDSHPSSDESEVYWTDDCPLYLALVLLIQFSPITAAGSSSFLALRSMCCRRSDASIQRCSTRACRYLWSVSYFTSAVCLTLCSCVLICALFDNSRTEASSAGPTFSRSVPAGRANRRWPFRPRTDYLFLGSTRLSASALPRSVSGGRSCTRSRPTRLKA